MYKKLEEFLNKNKDITISMLCTELGISRQTIYNWKRNQNIPNNQHELITRYIEKHSKNNESPFLKKKEALYRWRQNKAIEKKVLPTLIVSNDAIKLLSEFSIEKKTDILKIKGIGINKYNLYGDELYELLKQDDVKISCTIKFEIQYSEECKLLINRNDCVYFIENELYINDTHIPKDNITFKDEIFRRYTLNNIKFNIIRYETNIDYQKSKIEYTIFCVDQYWKTNINEYIHDFINKYYNRIKRQSPSIACEFNFKDIVAYVKASELDILLEITSEEIEALKDYDYNKEKREISEMLGLYIKYDDRMYDDLKDKLGGKIANKIDMYKGYYNYLNIILICNENIKKQMSSWLDNNYEELEQVSQTISKKGNVINFLDLQEKVFVHELGHLIFSYAKNNIHLNEKRANYIISDYFESKYDYFLNFMVKFQGYQYQNPLLKPEIDYILNNKYKNVLKMYDEYNKEVEDLYE